MYKKKLKVWTWRLSAKSMLFANLGIAAALPMADASAQQAPAAEPAATPEPATPVAVTSQDAVAANVGPTVIIAARRRSERMIDVPVAAIAVGAAEIRQYDLTAVANIKMVAPQISFDRGFTGGGASISMRGVSSSSLDAGLEQSVLLDFDGMAISRGRILNDAMFDIAEIDVLKGPQTLFYGKNSPGGVVSIKSAGPTRTLSGFARLGYEHTGATPSLEAAIAGPITDDFGFRIGMLASDSHVQTAVQPIPRPELAELQRSDGLPRRRGAADDGRRHRRPDRRLQTRQ
jgi:outer membrane receptor protein involved in Fe transport